MYCENVKVDRNPTNDEKELLRELMATGKPEAYRFIRQIEDLQVKIECTCRCARIYFIEPPVDEIIILENRVIDREDGESEHYYEFASGETLGGLDILHYDKFGDQVERPKQAILRKSHL